MISPRALRAHRPTAAALALAAVVFIHPRRAESSGLSFELPKLGTTTFQMTSTSLLRFRGDNYDLNRFDDDFFSFYQRFDASLQANRLRFETRIDAFVPFVDYAIGGAECPSGIQDDARCYLDWDVRPERLTLRWDPTYEWIVEAGDSQTVLGRGVALSFRKVDLLGVDNALRGGHIRYQGRDFYARAHAGVANPQNQDPIDLSIIEDPNDVVVGGAVGVKGRGPDAFRLGLQQLRVWFEDDDVTEADDRAVDVSGVVMEVPGLFGGRVALYGEANIMRRSESLNDGPMTTNSRGVYGSAQLQLDKVTLLLEWKDYTNFLVAPSTQEANAWRIYNAAPAVEFDGPQRLRGIGNQRGGGAQFDYAFLPGPWAFSLASVFYGFNDEVPDDPWDGIWVTHSWAGIQRRPVYGDGWTWSFNADAGGRFEIIGTPTLVDEIFGLESGDLDRSIAHGSSELVVAYGDHSFDLTVDHRFETERALNNQTGGRDLRYFEIGGAALTYSLGWRWTLALGMQWTDYQPEIVERRVAKPYNFDGKLYPSLETRYSFTPGTFINLFVGQTPGGQVCSGGICREVPPYEGVNVSFVARI